MSSLSTNPQKRRFISVFLPHFAIENQRLLQQQKRPHDTQNTTDKIERPQPQPAPLALIDQTSRGQRLSAVDEAAREQGLAPDMALSDALTLCPSLITQHATPRKDASKLLRLANWCERYSPLSNVYDENSLWIDVTGTTHLFKDEQSLLAKIDKDFCRLGYTAKLSLAGSFAAAFALSHFSLTHSTLQHGDFEDRSKVPIIPPKISREQLRNHLCPLPIKALRLCTNTSSLLHRLGLMTIGQLMDLPRESLKLRFPSLEQAKAVLLRLDQIMELRDEPLAPLSPPVIFASRLRFAEALFSKQMLEQALSRLIKTVIRQLELQNHGARKLTFTLWRSDGSTSTIKIGTAQPCREGTHLTHLFKEKLDQIEPGFGIDVIALFVEKAEPLSARQVSLANRQNAHGAESPDILIDRLRNHLGVQKIGYLQALQSHIPERAQKISITPQKKATPESLDTTIFHRKNNPLHDRPFLLLDPPETIEVMAALPDAPPVSFTWRRVTRRVIASNGPERITPEWWLELGETASRPRDYYKVRAKEGGLFWLFRNGSYQEKEGTNAPPQWYMHGFFG